MINFRNAIRIKNNETVLERNVFFNNLDCCESKEGIVINDSDEGLNPEFEFSFQEEKISEEI
jgi:hypothetical protein